MRYLLLCATLISSAALADGQSAPLPAPAQDIPLTSGSSQQTTVFSGGCFWGVQLVFQHVKGVISATSGYAGGTKQDADYETVSSGSTGHAESVEVVYDPSKISYGQLLKIFFSVAHDPTELNRQGPDTGTQYRSAIWTTNSEQQNIARDYIAQLDTAHVYTDKIVTQVNALPAFYPAEDYHQNFATLHPYNPYIYINDRPKLEHLKQQFPDWYK